MLMALALLAAIEVSAPTVSLTLTGETNRPPVSATPRSLSDVARELRKGRKAVGGFSAVESSVPQSRIVFIPLSLPEPEEADREPEVVTEVQPAYVPTYVPVWFGGGQRSSRLHQRPAARPASPPPVRPSQPMLRLRHTTAGFFRQR
jgi:hypothetical protein